MEKSGTAWALQMLKALLEKKDKRNGKILKTGKTNPISDVDSDKNKNRPVADAFHNMDGNQTMCQMRNFSTEELDYFYDAVKPSLQSVFESRRWKHIDTPSIFRCGLHATLFSEKMVEHETITKPCLEEKVKLLKMTWLECCTCVGIPFDRSLWTGTRKDTLWFTVLLKKKGDLMTFHTLGPLLWVVIKKLIHPVVLFLLKLKNTLAKNI